MCIGVAARAILRLFKSVFNLIPIFNMKTTTQTRVVNVVAAPASTPITVPAPGTNQVRHELESLIQRYSNISPRSVTSTSPASETQLTEDSARAEVDMTSSSRTTDHINNRTKYGYVYQIPLPERSDEDAEWLEVSLDRKRTFRESVAGFRAAKGMGLREWEWTAGELIADDSDDSDDSDHFAYAERVRSFTYKRSDDPILKGKKVVRVRGRRGGLRWVDGDFEDEVEDPDYVPEEDKEDERGLRPFRDEDGMEE